MTIHARLGRVALGRVEIKVVRASATPPETARAGGRIERSEAREAMLGLGWLALAGGVASVALG